MLQQCWVVMFQESVLLICTRNRFTFERTHHQPDTLLPFAWQLVEGCIFSDIASLVKNDPRYSVLLDADEDAESLAKLPPEDILLRWFNYHLRQSGSDLTVSNF